MIRNEQDIQDRIMTTTMTLHILQSHTYLKQATFGTPHRHIGIILIAKHAVVVIILRRLRLNSKDLSACCTIRRERLRFDDRLTTFLILEHSASAS
jgi:hypothetical protein